MNHAYLRGIACLLWKGRRFYLKGHFRDRGGERLSPARGQQAASATKVNLKQDRTGSSPASVSHRLGVGRVTLPLTSVPASGMWEEWCGNRDVTPVTSSGLSVPCSCFLSCWRTRVSFLLWHRETWVLLGCVPCTRLVRRFTPEPLKPLHGEAGVANVLVH